MTVIHKLDHLLVLLTTRWTCHSEIFYIYVSTELGTKFFFRRYPNFLTTHCRTDGRKLLCEKETSISRSAVSKELESRSTDLWQTQTDRWTQLGHGIYSDSTATRGKKRKTPIFSLLWRRMKSPVHRTWEVCFIVHLKNCFSDSMNTFAAKVCRFGGKCNHRS